MKTERGFFQLKTNEKPVIVVEGKSDVQRLEQLIDADFIICNGSAIDEATIDYIRETVKVREVIVLTDPDYPGMKIRHTIEEAVPEVCHAFIDRNKASDGKKLGVAECEKEEILRALSSYIRPRETIEYRLTAQDLLELKLTGNRSSERRERVASKFHLGYCNAKTLLKRMNMIHLTKQEIEEALHDCE